MTDLERLSFSIEKPLLDRLNQLVKAGGYANRSEYIRDLIRGQLVKEQWDRNQEVVGAITLVYDHHVPGLSEKLTHLQHHRHANILATTHVHMDKHVCVEVILVKGKAGQVKQIAELLATPKGVLHSELSMSSTGVKLGH